MNGVLVIARREVVERSFVFLVALALSVMPFAIVYGPWRSSEPSLELLGLIGMITGIGIGLALAPILGVSMVGRETSEKRMSFYFSKPVASSAIWFGKLSAAIFMVVAGFLIASGPALLVAKVLGPSEFGTLLVAVLLGSAILVLSMHAASTAVRSRSPLVVLDLVMTVALLFGALGVARVLLFGGAAQLLYGFLILLVAVPVLSLGAAGAWQISRGRIDRTAQHRAFSWCLWSVLGVVALTTSLGVRWLTAGTPGDLDEVFEGFRAPRGSWSILSGTLHHRGDFRQTFVADLNGAAFLPLPGDATTGFFSDDGKVMGWATDPAYFLASPMEDGLLGRIASTASWAGSNRGPIQLRRLDDPRAPLMDTGVTVGHHAMVKSNADGSRLAIIEDGLFSLQDVKERRSLGSARIGDARTDRSRMFFMADDLVRIYVTTTRTVGPSLAKRNTQIFEFDAKTRTLTRTGEFGGVSEFSAFEVTPDGSRLLLRSRMPPERDALRPVPDSRKIMELLDARTGAHVADIPGERPAFFHASAAQSDGRVVIADTGGDQAHLNVIERDGVVVKTISLGRSRYCLLLGEVRPHVIAVSLSDPGAEWRSPDWRTLLIDTESGATVREERDLKTGIMDRWSDDPRLRAGLQAPVLGSDRAGRLVAWDPQAGSRKVIAVRSRPM